MYISSLTIKGYKNAARPSKIILDRGLNILLGENGCGKTAIINALRLILREPESYSSFSEEDFYCSLDKVERASEVKIDAGFSGLNEDEKITFLTWCDADFNAQLHALFSENTDRPGFLSVDIGADVLWQVHLRKIHLTESSVSIFHHCETLRQNYQTVGAPV